MYGQLSKGRKYIDYGKYLSNLLFLEQRQRVTSLSFPVSLKREKEKRKRKREDSNDFDVYYCLLFLVCLKVEIESLFSFQNYKKRREGSARSIWWLKTASLKTGKPDRERKTGHSSDYWMVQQCPVFSVFFTINHRSKLNNYYCILFSFQMEFIYTSSSSKKSYIWFIQT